MKNIIPWLFLLICALRNNASTKTCFVEQKTKKPFCFFIIHIITLISLVQFFTVCFSTSSKTKRSIWKKHAKRNRLHLRQLNIHLQKIHFLRYRSENWVFLQVLFLENEVQINKNIIITEWCFPCQNKSVCQKLAWSCKEWKSAHTVIEYIRCIFCTKAFNYYRSLSVN